MQCAQAEASKPDWLARMLGRTGGRSPQVLVAPIAAGEVVVASRESDLFRFLRERYGDALAVEMEAYGFLHAAYVNPGVDALVIRGISDLVAGKGAADRAGWQDKASRYATPVGGAT